MNIVVLSQFFYPEIGAPAARFLDFARHFRHHGHRVTVITGFPNFPSGRIHEGYEPRPFMEEEIEGIRVLRTWLFASERATVPRKALGYASFALSSSLAGVLAPLDIDVLVATAPPPSIGVPALVTALRRHVPLVYDLRDLWPEAVILSGRLPDGPIARALERLNHVVYDTAAAITTVSDGKRSRLIELGVDPAKVHVIPNGVDIAYFDQCARSAGHEAQRLREQVGLAAGDVVLTYAGIMNPPQGLDMVLDAAEVLAKEPWATRVRILLVGGGSRRMHLEREVKRRELANVRFLPEQPRATVYALLHQATATLVPLRPRRDDHTVPSKIFECMAAAHPVLLSADGEPARILQEAGAGWVSPAGDLDSFVDGVRELVASDDPGRQRGLLARAYVERHYDRDQLSARFLGLLESLAAARGSS